MKVGFYQFFPEFGNKEANIEKVLTTLENKKADLIVLPELFNTGYQFISKDEVSEFAEEIPDGLTSQSLLEISRKTNISIIAGLCEKENGKIYNTSVFVTPSGIIGSYRKIHLFFEETFWFEPGDRGFDVYSFEDINVGMLICFDWVFPEAARILSLRGADIIVHPSNLVLPYCQNAMVTRSIENSVFSITANRIGSERRGGKKELNFTGGSQVTGPRGNVLLKAGDNGEELGIVEINPYESRNKKLSEINDLFGDRRTLFYSDLVKS